MSELSALLLLTCVGCVQTSSTAQAPSAICADSKSQEPPLPLSECTLSEFTKSILRKGSPVRSLAPEANLSIDWSKPSSNLAQSTVPSPALRLGSQGQGVASLQVALQRLGYDSGAIDGVYGQQTQSAVAQFQKEHHLRSDGVVGLKSWLELKTALSRLESAALFNQPNITPKPSGTESIPSIGWSNDRANSALVSRSPLTDLSDSQAESEVDVSSQWSASYGWLLGWGVLYGAGWMWIAGDALKFKRSIKKAAAHRCERGSDTPFKPPSEIESPVQSTISEPDKSIPTESILDIPIELLEVKWADEVVDRSLQERCSEIPSQNDEDEETLVVVLPKESEADGIYSYSLVGNSEELFVLRDNELRVLNHRLKHCKVDTRLITVCRTDANGNSAHKSFRLDAENPPEKANVTVTA
jgi:Putative peptidoglycan binding domain